MEFRSPRGPAHGWAVAFTILITAPAVARAKPSPDPWPGRVTFHLETGTNAWSDLPLLAGDRTPKAPYPLLESVALRPTLAGMRRARARRNTGAWVGGALGVVTGVLVGLSVSRSCDASPDGPCVYMIPITPVVFGILGAAIGSFFDGGWFVGVVN